jgi:Family of unknown function (DUF5906)
MSDNNDEDRPNTPLLFGAQYQDMNGPQKIIGSKQDVYDFFKNHANIKISGKFKILVEEDDGKLEFMDKGSFRDYFHRYKIDITNDEKTKTVPIAELWLNWPDARSYKGLIFDPSTPNHHDGYYNLFKGYKVKPIKGDCTIFFDYMKDIICSGNEEHFNYLVALVAQMFQFPHLKPGVAVALRGTEGVGKSFFIEKLGHLMGPYYFKTSNPDFIFGDFNSQLRETLLLHLEEAVFAGSRRDDSKMKDTITGPTLEINTKSLPLYVVDNHLHLFLSGNPDHLVRAGFDSRRIFALHVSDARRVDIPYFAGIDTWFKSGGAEALMHFFMNHKSDIDLRSVPITDELIFQRKKSASGLEKWAINYCEEGIWPYGDVKKDGTVQVIKKLLLHSYNNSPEGKRDQLSSNEFGNRFSALFPLVVNGIAQQHHNGKPISIIESGRDVKIKDRNGKWQYRYVIPKIDITRGALDFRLSGGKLITRNSWEEIDKWTTLDDNLSKDINDTSDEF